MFSLVDDLEHTLLIDNKEYKFDMSFDVVLRFYELLEDDNLKGFEKVSLAFDMFYIDDSKVEFTYEQRSQAIEDIIDYLRQMPYGNEESENQSDTFSEPDKLYSYTQDAGAIYSSFLMDYGIDLFKERGRMHYLTFRSLLHGLSEKTQFERILSIRARPTTGLKGEQLTNLLDLKRYYALDSEKTVDQLDNQMGDIFSMLATRAQQGKEGK
ncbi:Gp15 family bacteriophage protein [Tetragenococcus halophilus]|uniref:Gp15 family bacteriophage protein n=1 Tax=Tetragenococcus halophilus TaxID=51669 RepID=UPI00077C8693|nr:Gp15 family bacteriophage protein [Tetragenococcus halophilus]